MAYSNRFRTMFNDNFKILTWVLILFIAITPNFIFIHAANASAAEKWTIEQVEYNNVGKTLSYTAQKNYGSAANDYKYKTKVPVTAAAAGSTALSMFRYGVASAALYGLLEGVGWIIDNGVVKKIDPNTPVDNTSYPYLWFATNTINYVVYSAPSMNEFAQLIHLPYENFQGRKYEKIEIIYNSNVSAFVRFSSDNHQYSGSVGAQYRANNQYDPDYQPQYVPVTASEMGNEILDSPAAPEIVPDIYSPNNPVPRPSPAPDAVETALDNAAPIPKEEPKGDTKKKPNKDTDEDGEPDEYDLTLPDNGTEFELPPACEWIPVVCEWYVEYKQDVQKVSEWTKELPDEPDESSVEVDLLPIEFDDTQRINFSNSCPSPEQFSVSFFGTTQNLEFSYQPLCNFMSMIKPFVVAGSYLIGAYIVMGLSRGSGD